MSYIVKKKIKIPYYSNDQRTVRICLPDDYESSKKTYPVIYFHDGQNVFYGTKSGSGLSWEVLETIETIEEQNNKQFIVVAIDCSEKRLFEYLPWRNETTIGGFKKNSIGGEGDKYADFFVKTLKPYIDKNFRTKPDYKNTSIIGSSLGGLMSAYICAKYPDVFSKVGVFSLASYPCEEKFLDFIAKHKINKSTKYFIQVGDNEDYLPDFKPLPQIYLDISINYLRKLLELGVDIRNIYFGIGHGDGHNENSWSKHVRDFILF